jgi:hypothetical protein
MSFPRVVPTTSQLLGGFIHASIVIGIAASATLQAFGQVCVPVVPCTDKHGCPDLAFDPTEFGFVSSQIMTFSSTDCAVVEGEVVAGTRNMLLFFTDAANLGPGDLFLGNPADHPDWFDLVTCHGHPHLKDYAAFRLWKPTGYARWQALRAATPEACADQIFAAHPELSSQLLSNSKHAFCVMDEFPMKRNSKLTCPSHGNGNSTFDCSFQGISVCWEDSYFPGLSGQWIDITDVRDGDYVLENEVNDKHFMTETDYTNNSGAVKIRILGGVATPLP